MRNESQWRTEEKIVLHFILVPIKLLSRAETEEKIYQLHGCLQIDFYIIIVFFCSLIVGWWM